MLKKWIKNNIILQMVEWCIAIAIALLTLLLIVTFVARTADVSGISMEPTLSDKDRVLIVKAAYYFGKPRKGDIIAFPYKADYYRLQKGEQPRHFVKRVIGLPGDAIDFMDGNLYVNGEIFRDEFFDGGWIMGDTSYPLTVPDDSYFVLGDNRGSSEDSRFSGVGCIPLSEIDGKVAFRLFPLNKMGGLKTKGGG